MYTSVRLNQSHDIRRFTCGKAELDEWLKASAIRAQQAGTARTYVWTEGDHQKVLAYYAISPTEVVREIDGISRSLSGGYNRIPGYLIARLALDASLHGQGLGGQLLLDAVGKAVTAAETGGGRLIVVDALDQEAHAFYLKYGFTPVRNRENRLVMKVATARSSLAD
jgi:GNAT superfamily N-acetyltransferase